MKKLDYLIGELLKEDNNLSNIEIPELLEEKKDLYRALRNIRNPKPISIEYLKIQDEYLQNEINEKGVIDEKTIPFEKDIISIWQGDITTLKCDVIVNACNEYLLGCFNPTHRCIDNTIHSFAGMQLREECNNIMHGKTLPNGEVVLTNAYNLPSKYIIH
ncbi:MAG: macro domain-containing protein, partial [Bacteroidetes bacterium]|nr:macro domain-containing protein [Bacteroidota bacterium]